ncbi:MAG: hypothetical protein JXA82_10890 [Sedimentisphaerales bacterium]|nr:hypothetical protein [Sedimentisphaerales bacterium]
MPNKSTEKLISSLREAQAQIEESFINQCEHGAQTKNLSDVTMAACGQFVGPNTREVGQRGLHGTAAAIKVISQVGDVNAHNLVKRLVNYAANRSQIEMKVRGEDDRQQSDVHNKCELDDMNVIKSAELLEALAYARQCGVDTGNMIQDIQFRLNNSILQDQGWRYFTDDKEGPPEMLPTAYVLMGLAKSGLHLEANKADKYLRDRLTHAHHHNRSNPLNRQSLAVHIACLYALTFRDRPSGQSGSNELKEIFQALWRLSVEGLRYDDEQNVPYWHVLEKTCYVRVPWQLYLIALAAHYNFPWIFSNPTSLKMLQRAVTAAHNSKPVYPQSGPEPSARTSAILHDVLGHLVGLLDNRDLAPWPRWMDLMKHMLGHRVSRYMYLLSAILIVVLSVKSAYSSRPSIWPELAPGFVGAAVLLLGKEGMKAFKRRGDI